MAKVLIVDDALFAREKLKGVLEAAGHETIDAETGEAALVKFKEEKPDVVLLDIIMERTPGDVVLEQMKEWDPKAKVIMVTAVGQKEEMKECFKRGAVDYIIKPLVQDQVVKAVQKALE